MKTASSTRRAFLWANVFNLLVAIYFIVIAITALIQLRWYHQLTITVKVRHVVTTASSYFAFLILILAALLLLAIFILSALNLSPRTYVSPKSDTGLPSGAPTSQLVATSCPATPAPIQTTAPASSTPSTAGPNVAASPEASGKLIKETSVKRRLDSDDRPWFGPRVSHPTRTTGHRLMLVDSTSRQPSNSRVGCFTLLHLVASISLIIILCIWLFNTGELVRDSISTQLEAAYMKYQSANRSNHYSVAIDGLQDINHCCGLLDYTDFPHRRSAGLSGGQYPGSCCGKNIYGVNARVNCSPEDVVRARQTAGCVQVLANYYDLISILVVPVALVSLFVNITIIALITVTKVHLSRQDSSTEAKFELKPVV